MPYTGSGAAITKVEAELRKLVASKGDIIFVTDDPTKLAWHIRNGIKTAKRLGIKQYASLEQKFIIRIRPDKVKCELRNELEHVFTVKEFDHITSPLSIIQVCIDNSADEWQFCQTGDLNKSQLSVIHRWAVANERSISYNSVKQEGYLVITNQSNQNKWTPDA